MKLLIDISSKLHTVLILASGKMDIKNYRTFIFLSKLKILDKFLSRLFNPHLKCIFINNLFTICNSVLIKFLTVENKIIEAV